MVMHKCIRQYQAATATQKRRAPLKVRWVPIMLIVSALWVLGSPCLHAIELSPNPNPSGIPWNLPADTYTVSTDYLNNGYIIFAAGSGLTILPGATFEARGNVHMTYPGANFINQGTLANSAWFGIGGQFRNFGIINNDGDLWYESEAHNWNSGTITNNGSFFVRSLFDNNSIINNAGSLEIGSGASGYFTNTFSGTFNNSGLVEASVDGHPVPSQFRNEGFATNSGTFIFWNHGSLLRNDFTFTNTNTGILQIMNLTNNGNFYNYGTIHSGLYNWGVTGFINTAGGIFENYGTLAAYANTLENAGTLRNYGTIQVGGLDWYGNLSGATLLFNGTSLYGGNGSIELYNTSQFTNNAAAGAVIAALDAAQNSNAVINGSSATSITAGRILDNGRLTYSGTGSLGIGTLTLENGAALVSSGNNLSIGTASVGAGNSATISGANPLTLGTANVDGALTVSGILGGAGSLTKTGAGLLILTGANTYSGGTIVSGGTLQGNTTSLQGNILNNASVVFDQAVNGTYGGVMSGNGSLTKQGAGLLTLTGANNYSGSTMINAGVLQAGRANIFSSTAPVQLANTAGAVFDLNGFDQTVGGLIGGGAAGGNVTLGSGALTVQNAANNTFGGTISGSGSLTKSGAGTLILTGANSYSGGTTVSGGTLQGDTVSLQGNILNNASVVFDQGFNGTYGGVMSGSGSLTKSGAGALALTGTNSYSGGTTINAGILSVGNDANLGNPSGTLTFNGGTLQTSALVTLGRNVVLNAGGGTVDTPVGNVLSIAGTISGAGPLTKTGVDQLILTGANSYSGGTTVSGGTLQGDTVSLQGNILNNASVVFDQAVNGTYGGVMSGSGSLTKNGAGTLALTGTNSYGGGTIVSGGTLQGDTVSLQGNILNNASVVFDQGFNGTYAGVMSGSGSLTKNGAGTLTLSGANSYTGNTTINAGTLSNTGSLTSSGLLTNLAAFQSSGTLTNFNIIDNYNAFSNSGTLTNNGLVQNNAGGVITNTGTLNNAGNLFNSGVLSNSGVMTNTNAFLNLMLMDSSGTFNNNLAMLNLGSLNVSGTLNNNMALLNGGSLTIGSGGVFNHTAGADYNDMGAGMLILGGTLNNSSNNPLNITNLSFTGGVFTNTGVGGANITTATVGAGTNGLIQGSGSLSLGTANIDGTLTVNSAISGAGALSKLGTGTLYLNGANTYTGGTDITGGALSVNGSILGPVNIGAAGTLKGSGSINGSVTNSGTIAPGNSIGTTTITGNYTHNAGAIYQVEANAAGQSDKLNVTGTATLNGGTVSVLAENGKYLRNTNYTILTAGSVQGSFSNVTSNLAFLTPSLRYDPSNVYLTLTRNNTSFADVALTPNQRAVATTLDRIYPTITGDMITVTDALLALSDSGARSAYNQMGGLTHTAMAGATFSALNQYMGTLSGRMESYRLGKTAQAERTLYASSAQIANDASPATKAIEQAQWDIWIRGYGTKGYHRGDDISSNYDHWSGGSSIGIDRRLSREILFGVSAGYSHSELTMNDLPEKGKADSYQASVYGAYRGEALYVTSQLSYGYNRYDISRSIMFGGINRIAESDYSGHALSAAVEAGYRIRTSCIDIIPLVGFQAAYLSRNSFSEHGAESLNLTAGSESTNSLLSTVGFRLTKDYTVGNGILSPELRAKWLHEFSNDSYVLNAAFSGYPAMAFSVKGDRPDRDSAAVGAGVTYAPQKNLSLYVTYDAHLASDRTEHAGSVGVRYSW